MEYKELVDFALGQDNGSFRELGETYIRTKEFIQNETAFDCIVSAIDRILETKADQGVVHTFQVEVIESDETLTQPAPKISDHKKAEIYAYLEALKIISKTYEIDYDSKYNFDEERAIRLKELRER